MKLSVVIPARNEEGVVGETVGGVLEVADAEGMDCEVIVVDDASVDGTAAEVMEVVARDGRVRYLRSPNPGGFGFAVPLLRPYLVDARRVIALMPGPQGVMSWPAG